MKLDGQIVADIEIAVQKKQQQEYRKLGDYTPTIDGYTIFEYDKEAKTILPASFRTNETYVIGGENRPILEVKNGCIYVEALNIKNALKRLKRGDVIYSS